MTEGMNFTIKLAGYPETFPLSGFPAREKIDTPVSRNATPRHRSAQLLFSHRLGLRRLVISCGLTIIGVGNSFVQLFTHFVQRTAARYGDNFEQARLNRQIHFVPTDQVQ